jgi:hypothetical protein
MSNIGPITRRLLKWHDKASVDQLEDGQGWYLRARYFASELAERTGHTFDQVAALIAVLSPQVTWEKNMESAEMALQLWHDGWDGESIPGYTGYSNNVRKAKRILDGDMSALKGPKVTAFFNAIRGDLTDVVVDVWATRAARPHDHNMARLFRDDEMPGAREREQIAEAYRRAAALRGVAPSEMQAIVWVVVRDSGTFQKPQHYSDAEATRFYEKQIRARQKLGLTLYSYDSYFHNAPRARAATEAVLA